ncbi:MAG: Mur ligase family protein [Candidatus Saccharibacteria bacterium]|nr:Mur ligase family protein [Candidatus Saccharibacteria bacterium]
MKSFAQVEAWLATIQPDIRAVNWFFALEDMQDFMANLNNPQNTPKIVHVAGTSGKTSTCYFLSELLQTSNRRVGLSVSPHVDSVRERVQINNQPLAEHEFVEMFKEFASLPEVQSMQITYFGLLVAFAYWVYAQKKADYAVIEVGMGGRLDATNIVTNPNKICVITDIGMDHTQFLGEDLATIAGEKAGIIMPGADVFVAHQSKEVMNVFNKVAKKQNAALHILPDNVIEDSPEDLPPFQRRNFALAKFTHDFIVKRDNLISVDTNTLNKIAHTSVPARMEAFKYQDKTIITDGSHNAHKIGALVSGLEQTYPDQKMAAMVSFVDGKDVTLKESLQELKKVSDNLIVTMFKKSQDVQRGPISPDTIAETAKSVGFSSVTVVENPKEAFKHLLKQPEERLLVTGSFYLLNHVRPLLLSKHD